MITVPFGIVVNALPLALYVDLTVKFAVTVNAFAVNFSVTTGAGFGFDGAGFDGAGFDGAGFDGAGFDGAGFDGAGFVVVGLFAGAFTTGFVVCKSRDATHPVTVPTLI